MTHNHPLIVTDTDLQRLERVVEQYGSARNAELVEQLESELARAVVTSSDAIPRDVVTMNSTVVFEDEEAGETREVTLVYPKDANSDAGRISILAPVGSALIGLSVGQTVEWPLPNGRTRRLRIVAVPYQPEAAGHFHL
ncbi:nucleoside diphosphate kinase regulator [Corallococcus aberystwythensis]|uniref:Nucleoside diphosphate kinase regulator n=1 Tax=Corallococcus aberystwythensis TaxID=2316722 RepID=A0A3A8PUX4_9BACT|nr:nucleoside diphosphate kinase regulator [Corallococcus aberystwythensis]RKH59768.1 nucleoside diphosphate kinase regulator [Corallococcus aberystwythensis]